MEFKINNIIKSFVYLVIVFLSLNIISAVETVPGFQYGGDMISVGDNLYVSDSGNNAVLLFDKINMTLNKIFPVGSSPKDLLLEGNNLYVAVSGSSKIAVIDTTTNKIIDNYQLSFKPRSIAKKGNYMYILEDNSQWAKYPIVYDITSKKEIGYLPTYKSGNAPIYSPNYIQIVGNNLYFSETGSSSSTVFIYDITTPIGTFVKKSGFSDFSNIWDFDVDKSTGLLYVVNGRDLTVTDNNFVVKNTLKKVDYSTGLTDKLLFTYNSIDKLVKLYDKNTMLNLKSIDLKNYNFNYIDPNGIYLDNLGILYISGTNTFNKKSLIEVLPDGNGNIYVRDFLNDYSTDLKISNPTLRIIENSNSNSYYLDFSIENTGNNDISINNLDVNGTFLQNNQYISSLNGAANIVSGSIEKVTTYIGDNLLEGNQNLIYELNVIGPYYDINSSDNQINLNVNIKKFVPKNIMNSRNNQVAQNTQTPAVIVVDNSVNNVNIDNSVNTLNVINSSITANVNTNLNAIVNSSVNLNKNDNQKNIQDKNTDLRNFSENSNNNENTNLNNKKDVKLNDNKVSVEKPNISKVEHSGCFKDGITYDIGLRLYSSQNPTYCDVDKLFKIQKDIGSVCQNNFECGTNSCSSNVCTDINAKLDKQTNLLQQILDWLKSVFGGSN